MSNHDHDPRSTAFVLGELGADEARSFRELIEREPEAIERIEEVREISALMQESRQVTAPLELTPDQRQAILAAIPARPGTQRVSRAPWAFAAAAALVVGASLAALLMRDAPTNVPRVADNTLASQSPLPGVSADGRIDPQGATVPVAAMGADLEPTPVHRPIVMLDRTGKLVSEIAPPGIYHSFRLSPDGRQIALDQQSDSGERDIWIRDLSQGNVRRLTSGGGRSPAWSPDGRVVMFSDPVDDKAYRINSDGSGPRSTAFQSGAPTVLIWSPDGRQVVLQKRDPVTGWDLWMIPSPNGGVPQPLAISSFAEQHAAFSPDGRWIAYTSNESGRSEIYVRNFGSSAKYQASVNGATGSRWRADGSEMFYIAPGGQLMSVDVASKGDTLSLGLPRRLFRVPAPLAAEFEVTRDGQRFILFGGAGEP